MDAAGKKLEKLEKGSIDVLKNTLSFTILHELTHIPSCSGPYIFSFLLLRW